MVEHPPGVAQGGKAPAYYGGQLTCVQLRIISRETHRGHRAGVGDGGAQGQDGEVISPEVLYTSNVVGMVSDSRDGPDVRHGVSGVMLPKQHPHGGGGFPFSAVGSGQNVEGGDDRSSTKGCLSSC